MKFWGLLFIVCSVIVTLLFFLPNFLQWLIDKDNRQLTIEEDVEISKLIDDFYSDYFKSDYSKLKNFFFEEKVNINIADGHSLLTDYENNLFGTIKSESDFHRIYTTCNQYLGNLRQKQIVSKKFVLQPYDYPVGNIYYLDMNVQFENAESHQHFFIINEHGQFKIYEVKIEIL